MISAAQIREACALLDWTLPMLARRALLCFDAVSLALDDVRIRHLGGLQLGAVRATLEAAGIEFVLESGGGAGVRLRKVESRDPEP